MRFTRIPLLGWWAWKFWFLHPVPGLPKPDERQKQALFHALHRVDNFVGGFLGSDDLFNRLFDGRRTSHRQIYKYGLACKFLLEGYDVPKSTMHEDDRPYFENLHGILYSTYLRLTDERRFSLGYEYLVDQLSLIDKQYRIARFNMITSLASLCIAAFAALIAYWTFSKGSSEGARVIFCLLC